MCSVYVLRACERACDCVWEGGRGCEGVGGVFVCDDLAARVAEVIEDGNYDVRAVELAVLAQRSEKQGIPAGHLRAHNMK